MISKSQATLYRVLAVLSVPAASVIGFIIGAVTSAKYGGMGLIIGGFMGAFIAASTIGVFVVITTFFKTANYAKEETANYADEETAPSANPELEDEKTRQKRALLYAARLQYGEAVNWSNVAEICSARADLPMSQFKKEYKGEVSLHYFNKEQIKDLYHKWQLDKFREAGLLE